MEELKKGDNVFIVVSENSIFHGKYGIVDEVKENKAAVYFEKKFSHLIGSDYNRGKTTEEFNLTELKKFDLDEETEIKANRMFPSLFHFIYASKYKFSPENDCMYENCNKKAQKRILYNTWGSVCEYDVCEDHKDNDGRCGDGFNGKKNYHAVVMEKREKREPQVNCGGKLGDCGKRVAHTPELKRLSTECCCNNSKVILLMFPLGVVCQEVFLSYRNLNYFYR